VSYDCREHSRGDEPKAGDAYWPTMLVMLRDAEGVVRLLREPAMVDLQRHTEPGIWNCRSDREEVELAAVINDA